MAATTWQRGENRTTDSLLYTAHTTQIYSRKKEQRTQDKVNLNNKKRSLSYIRNILSFFLFKKDKYEKFVSQGKGSFSFFFLLFLENFRVGLSPREWRMSRAPEYILGEIFILFFFSLLLLLFWFFFFYRICFSTFGFVVLSASFFWAFLGSCSMYGRSTAGRPKELASMVNGGQGKRTREVRTGGGKWAVERTTTTTTFGSWFQFS